MTEFAITLAPQWADNTVAAIDFDFSLPAAALGDVQPVLHYPDDAYGKSVTFAPYEHLILTDDLGEVPYHIADAPSRSSDMIYRGVYAERPLQGTLHWQYHLLPRVLPAGYRSSPYYDFRQEPYGLNSSGYFSLILPNSEEKLSVHWRWDMAGMPTKARAIWSYGEGPVDAELSAEDLRFSLYAVGVMQAMESADFGIYWFTPVDFAMQPIFDKLNAIFTYMKHYFHDQDSTYHVFIRRDPFEHSGGGSACRYAFISGYSATSGIDQQRWFDVLVHEITHTWPTMVDDQRGEGTWFEEGCTEYYCATLPYRAGLLSADHTAASINEKTGRPYYHNVYRELSNMAIAKLQWQDRRAQPVPYGRGMVYLANVESELREANAGSIDSIVMAHSYSDPLTPDLWRDFVKERLGDAGVAEFEAMCAGKLVVPRPGLFGPDFVTITDQLVLEDGRRVVGYHWEVKG